MAFVDRKSTTATTTTTTSENETVLVLDTERSFVRMPRYNLFFTMTTTATVAAATILLLTLCLTLSCCSSFTTIHRYDLHPTILRWSDDVRTNRFASRSSSDETTTTLNSSKTQDELQNLTVKQLRLMVKELKERMPDIKSSNLKLKKDYVKFLSLHYSDHFGTEDQPNGEEILSTKTVPQRRRNTRDEINGSPSTIQLPSIITQVASQSSTNNTPLPPPKTRTPAPPMKPTTTTTTNHQHKSKKDLIFAEIQSLYPGIETIVAPPEYINHDDIRTRYHPMLKNLSNTTSDMDVAFIGTASCTPSVTRGVSCTALRLNWRRNLGRIKGLEEYDKKRMKVEDSYTFQGGTWLFDVGECTQLQLQRSISLKSGRITKIFLTHSHGDHTFGLPGLLCLMGQDRDKSSTRIIEIYGPEGLRHYLRTAIRYSVSRIVPNYRVHELMDIPMAPEWNCIKKNGRSRFYFDVRRLNTSWNESGLAGEDAYSWITHCRRRRRDPMRLERDEYYGEMDGGRDIYPSLNHPLSAHGAPVWEVLNEGDVIVRAAPMSHGVPCVGYVIQEQDKPGKLKPENVVPVIERNMEALKHAGVKVPMKLLSVVKNMREGEEFRFPDGTVVKQSEVVEKKKEGRKVVICGDTADARALEALGQNADLLIHEATNAYLQGIDKSDTNLHYVSHDAKIHGHSTPQMAGAFAKQINAKRLIMNHFSSRYKGDCSLESLSVMRRIERQAVESSGLAEQNVGAAWDFMMYPIPSK